ncbi:MAG: hypothetical protein ABI679_15200 [Gemmatimonadota bacterium]
MTIPTMDRRTDARDVTRVYTALFNRPVNAQVLTVAPAYGGTITGSVAAYAAADGSVQALCVLDLSLSVLFGAALMMIPAEAAREMIRDRQVEGNIQENLHEVANVASQLVNRSGQGRLALHDVYLPAAVAPAEVLQILANPATRLDLQLTIEGYGTGMFSLLLR